MEAASKQRPSIAGASQAIYVAHPRRLQDLSKKLPPIEKVKIVMFRAGQFFCLAPILASLFRCWEIRFATLLLLRGGYAGENDGSWHTSQSPLDRYGPINGTAESIQSCQNDNQMCFVEWPTNGPWN